MINKNCLSYWFPKLQSANLPVPKTEIITVPNGNMIMPPILDGKEFVGMNKLIDDIKIAIANIGTLPVFLRTGQGSGKHRWKNCCYLNDINMIGHHIYNLVEWSHMVSFLGLPHDVWAVREFLPTKPIAILPRYDDMPLITEVRAFICDGKVICSHDYWPCKSIMNGLSLPPSVTIASVKKESERLHKLVSTTIEQREEAHVVARKVAKTFHDDGYWSVDLLLTDRGWYITDMANGHESFHEQGCGHVVTQTNG